MVTTLAIIGLVAVAGIILLATSGPSMQGRF